MARRDFLAFFILTLCLVSGQSPRYVLKGQKVTLKKDVTGQPDNILWKYNGNKVIEFNGREERVYDPYKSRVTLDWSSAELDISDLRLEDSGKYELQVSVNQNLDMSYYDMEVLDRVAKPTVFCKINIDNSGTLVCSAEPRQPVHLMTFEWHSQGSVHPGPHLQISLGDEHDDKVYNCMVRNPLTTETAAFTAKDCYTTETSSAALIVTVILISLLPLIAGAGMLYCYRKQKGCFAKRQTDLEEQKTDLPEANKAAPGTEHLSESANKEAHQAESNCRTGAYEGHVKDKINKFNQNAKTDGDRHIADQHKGAISGQWKKKEFRRDQSSTDHQSQTPSSSVTPPDAGQNKDNIINKNSIVADKQEGHPSNKSKLPAESTDVASSEQKSSTAPASPDGKAETGAAETEQLSESADEEKQQDQLNSLTFGRPGSETLQSDSESRLLSGTNKKDYYL